MAKILVTGGLGYIGSHTVVELLQAKHEVVIVDNETNASSEMITRIEKITGVHVPYFKGDIRDENFLQSVFSTNQIEGVIHFAALKSVPESFENPEEYYSVNVEGTKTLCKVMEQNKVYRLVFSSSAAVYGAAADYKISEEAKLQPSNPYGESKVACEKFLEKIASENELWSIVMLRYFNPAGAHESGLIGDAPKTAASISAIIMEVVRGVRDFVMINGVDYDTPDGTCIRDFIHIVDLARAHIFALEFVLNNSGVQTFNVGTGYGYSVREIVDAFSRAVGQEIPVIIGPRREGDVVVAVADASKIMQELGWKAEYSLDDIAKSAVHWVRTGL